MYAICRDRDLLNGTKETAERLVHLPSRVNPTWLPAASLV
jgi:hypothetical protein